MDMTGHWHVAGGLSGYGPDAADGDFASATTWPELAELVRHELRDAAEYLSDTAQNIAESLGTTEAKAEAWDLDQEATQADVLARNFDNARMGAALYAGNADAWDAEVQRLVAEHFPYRYERMSMGGERLALYVWDCAESDCEHLTDAD